jgi:hypothetical protein
MANELEIREEILTQLHGIRPGSRGIPAIVKSARRGDVMVTESEIIREADYLTGKGMVERVRDEADPSVKRWKITPTGVDYVAEKGLA